MFRSEASRKRRLERRRVATLEAIDRCERNMVASAPSIGFAIINDPDQLDGDSYRRSLNKLNDKIEKLGGEAAYWNWDWRERLEIASSPA